MEKKFFYFLGNHPFHILHGLSLYRELGGEAIVLSEEARQYCEAKGVRAVLLDHYPEAYLKLSRKKIPNTLRYLAAHRGVVFFFEAFSIIPALGQLTKIMLFHGNSLKDWLDPWRVEMVNACDYVTALSPFREERMLQKGVDRKIILPIGLTRWDQIIRHAGKTLKQEAVFSKTSVGRRRILTYMPTWYGATSVNFVGKEIVRTVSDDYILVFRPHPETPKHLIDEYLEIIARKKNVLYVPENRFSDLTLMDLFTASDAFIGDMSSTIIDAILTEKPLLFALDSKRPRTLKPHLLLNRALKNLIYFGKGPFERRERSFSAVREIFVAAEKIDGSNVHAFNKMVGNALERGIDRAAWDKVKSRMFYSLDGDATGALVRLARQQMEAA